MRHSIWIGSLMLCGLGGLAAGQTPAAKPQAPQQQQTPQDKESPEKTSTQSNAVADEDRPTPPTKPARGRGSDEAVTTRGVVKSFHENPKGDVDGLTLADGTEVRIPPHLGPKLAEMIAKGDEVQVEGHKHTSPKGDTHMRAHSIRNVKSDVTLDVKASPPPERDRSKRNDEVAMTSRGLVKSFHENRRGDVDGLTLEDGSEIRFPPHVGKKLSAVVAKGDEVQVDGHKQTDPKGDTYLRAGTIKNVKSGESIEVGRPHERSGPPHQQMLAEIRAIRELIDDSSDDVPEDADEKRSEPPHEQVLQELRDLRRLLEERDVDEK
jgi:hypothetical protein